jgi:hypothetical protein
MNWPSCAGWLNILGVFLNAAGVLFLFFFKSETPAPLMERQRVLNIKVENLARVPWQRVGVGCIGLGWAGQALAQCFP